MRLAAATDVIEFVGLDLAAEGVAMNAEEFGGAGLIAISALECALDEFFFEFGDGFLEKDAPFDHHPDERLQLIFHDSTLRATAIRRGKENMYGRTQSGAPPGRGLNFNRVRGR